MIEVRTQICDGVTVSVEFSRTEEIFWSGVTDAMTAAAKHEGLCFGLEGSLVPGSYMFGFGRQDLLIGHAAFDDRFIVKCKSAALAQLWFTDEVCEALIGTYDPNEENPLGVFFDESGVTVRNRTAPQHLMPSRALGVAVKAMLTPMPSFAQKPAAHRKTDAAVRACAVFINRSKQLASQWQKHLEPAGNVTAPLSFSTDERGTFVIQRGHMFAYLDFPWRVPNTKDGLRSRVRFPKNSTVLSRDGAAQRTKQSLDPKLANIFAAAKCDWSLVDDIAIEVGWLGMPDPLQLQTLLVAVFDCEMVALSPFRD